jgi:predicted alpha/beta hydrolase family esterase
MSSVRIQRYRSGPLARSFLILHGYQGSGPGHWQTWLAERLAAAGERVSYPALPDPHEPSPPAWRAALAAELRGAPIVIAHSLACILWLHHCADARAERVLLVAPPSLAGAPEPIRSFFPVPLDAAAVAAAAERTRLVCSDDDPYCPEGAASVYGEPLGLDVELLEGAGHINPDAGFGPWPAAEAWCYGESAIASSRIAPG